MFSDEAAQDILRFCTREELDAIISLTPEGCHWTWKRWKWEVAFVLWTNSEDLVGTISRGSVTPKGMWRCQMTQNLCQCDLISCAKALTSQYKASLRPLPKARATYSAKPMRIKAFWGR
jgi:hypothetical protein